MANTKSRLILIKNLYHLTDCLMVESVIKSQRVVKNILGCLKGFEDNLVSSGNGN